MSSDFLNFTPLEREILLDEHKPIWCKYNTQGIIEYVNDDFAEITGYEVFDVVGNPVDSLIHPELPKTIIQLVNEHIEKGINIHIILKDQIKDGRYYWYLTDYEFHRNENSDIESIINKRFAIPRYAVFKIEKFYQKLLKIEQHTHVEIAKNFFEGFNEENNMTFESYTKQLILQDPQNPMPKKIEEKQTQEKSIWGKLFKK